MRKTIAATVGLTVVMMLSSTAMGAAESILVRDNAFEPGSTEAVVGQAVVWATGASTSDLHNVREDHKLFFSGRPDQIDFTFKRVFSAGTFHYFCERHGFRRGGMDGTVKVPVTLQATPAGADFTVKWATSDSNTGSTFAVQYKVGSGAWKTWKSATRARYATFSGSSGDRYTFRVRSMKGESTSRWSPVASIQA